MGSEWSIRTMEQAKNDEKECDGEMKKIRVGRLQSRRARRTSQATQKATERRRKKVRIWFCNMDVAPHCTA
jgi:hypothetical protein